MDWRQGITWTKTESIDGRINAPPYPKGLIHGTDVWKKMNQNNGPCTVSLLRSDPRDLTHCHKPLSTAFKLKLRCHCCHRCGITLTYHHLEWRQGTWSTLVHVMAWWRHQAITWINVYLNLSSIAFCGIHRPISQEVFKISSYKMRFHITL